MIRLVIITRRYTWGLKTNRRSLLSMKGHAMFKIMTSEPCIQIAQLAAIALCCVAVLVGCGNDDEDDPIRTGLVQVTWASSDCSAEDALQMVAMVYDASYGYITYGGPWSCSSEQGTISGVSTGISRSVVLFAEDSSGAFKLRGEYRNIDVQENAIAYADNIKLTPFVVFPIRPDDGASLSSDFFLTWQYVAGAAKYHVTIAENANFLNPNISEAVAGPPYSLLNLTAGVGYYWKVNCQDIYGNEGMESAARQFTILGPVVTITSPQDGAEYSLANNIRFSGEGYEQNGEELAEESLVWQSSIDGELTTGRSFRLFELDEDVLSEGSHIITLTGTDINGFSESDSITLHIVAAE